MTGGDKVRLCIHDLNEDIKVLHMANKEDDKRDDDNDGIPDVKQASPPPTPLTAYGETGRQPVLCDT